uniref:Integrase, catalytic region, zinc finger, CCHC-type, peptidase aspartic, catalytic n=1 Tax=Tanacetum cinerariifolium TaxID=118510 RepID=A0A6L2KJZ5_TANCI|nr:hypothetical protein [Tanacetum cinerariifolium]
MSQDVMTCVINSTAIFDDVNVEMQSSEFCMKCLDLDVELLNKQNAYNDLLKSYSQIKKHCISHELLMQLNQEIFQKNSLSNNQNALEIPKYFENNVLKAHLQAKDTTIYKEIKPLKKVYEGQFDSIKKTRALSKEHCDSLIAQLNYKSMENADLKGQIQEKVFVTTALQNELRKLKGKNVHDNAATITNATSITLGMFKLDLDPLAPKILKNRNAHIDYLKYTQDQADILQGIVKQAKAKQPLDNALEFACCPDCSLVSGLQMLETYDKEPISAHELRLVPNPVSQQPFNPPTRNDRDCLFEPMFFEHFNPPSSVVSPVPVTAAPRAVDIAGSPSSTTIDQDAPSSSTSSTNQQQQSSIISQGIEEPIPNALFDDPCHEALHDVSTLQESLLNVQSSHSSLEQISRWTKDHPLANVIGNPSRPVSIRKKLKTDAMWC